MRHTATVSLALALLHPAGTAQQPDAPLRELAGVKLAHFTVQRITFPAPSLESVWAEYAAYLPAGHDPKAERRYPFVIWLHGMSGDWRQFHHSGAALLDRLRGEGKIPDLIFIAPSAGRRSLYFNGERSGDYEDLIVRDLREDVEQRLHGSTRREERALMGISSGGFGALRFALKHRDLFATVVAHSAPAFPIDPKELPARFQRQAEFLGQAIGLDAILGDPIDPERWAREIPSAILARLAPADVAGLRIHFDVGTRDRYGFAEPNVELHEALEARGIPHSFALIEGGGHAFGSGFGEGTLATSLQLVGEALSGKGG